MRDMLRLAVETLTAKGTPRALGLAGEIQRGEDRKTRLRDDLERSRAATAHSREHMLPQLRPAEPHEWAAWVDAYLACTRRPVIHRHAFPTDGVYVATCDLEVFPLYGASALHVILPRGIRDFGGDTGHTGLYGYSAGGVTYRGFHDQTWPHYVDVYADTELTPGVSL